MRLIDADVEVERGKEFIERLELAVKTLEESKEDNTILITAFKNVINKILKEIEDLNSYKTAYDLDVLLDGLNEILKNEVSQLILDRVYECVQRGNWD